MGCEKNHKLVGWWGTSSGDRVYTGHLSQMWGAHFVGHLQHLLCVWSHQAWLLKCCRVGSDLRVTVVWAFSRLATTTRRCLMTISGSSECQTVWTEPLFCVVHQVFFLSKYISSGRSGKVNVALVLTINQAESWCVPVLSWRWLWLPSALTFIHRPLPYTILKVK